MGKTIDNILGRIERIVEPLVFESYFGREHQTIGKRIKDNFDYIKARIVYWEYRHKDNYCTACGIASQEILDAIMTISEFENRKKQMRK